MRVLMFEDEALTADRLIILLKKYDPDIEILAVLESVKQGIKWFQENPNPDLIFMDIHLSDGSSFEIFAEVKINTPIIFTTAYDKYAIQAFKVNSIDYLLKPIDFEELKAAISKFENLKANPLHDIDIYKDFLHQIMKPYKKRFLIKTGEQLKYINTEDIAYFMYDESLVFAYANNSKRFIVDQSIGMLENLLDPDDFYRINRKFIISLKSIAQIHTYFNSRLKLRLTPDIQTDVIVSREKALGFKKWLNK
jgi:two-component system, LytTR family, response regulator LytT